MKKELPSIVIEVKLSEVTGPIPCPLCKKSMLKLPFHELHGRRNKHDIEQCSNPKCGYWYRFSRVDSNDKKSTDLFI